MAKDYHMMTTDMERMFRELLLEPEKIEWFVSGIAPNANIIMLKCLEKSGNGSVADAKDALILFYPKRNAIRFGLSIFRLVQLQKPVIEK